MATDYRFSATATDRTYQLWTTSLYEERTSSWPAYDYDKAIATPAFDALESQVWRMSGFIAQYLLDNYGIQVDLGDLRGHIQSFCINVYPVYKEFSSWLHSYMVDRITETPYWEQSGKTFEEIEKKISRDANFQQLFGFVAGYFQAIVSILPQ